MDAVLFVVFPYFALSLALLGGLYRYFALRFSFSSLSSQLLEGRQLFWGSVPWHFGIVLILLAHLFAGLFPSLWAVLLGGPTRLAVIEQAGLALALYTIAGLGVLIFRRARPGSLPRAVTSPMDWVLLVLLASQVALGFLVALTYRWGARWYLETASPWFLSILKLGPDFSTMVPLPALVKLHALLGLALVAIFPFTRLVHIFTVPLGYLWRPYQLVFWERAGSGAAAAWPGRGRGRGRGRGPSPPPAPPAPAPDPAAGDAGRGRMPRRAVLSALSLGLGSLVAAIAAIPAFGFLLELRRQPGGWQRVGRADRFPEGQTVKISLTDPSPLPWAGVTARTAAWLRRTGAETFVVFSVSCTHLGCPVRWLPDAELFMCPCHGGGFYADGRVAPRPPRRPLARYLLRVRRGEGEVSNSPPPGSPDSPEQAA